MLKFFKRVWKAFITTERDLERLRKLCIHASVFGSENNQFESVPEMLAAINQDRVDELEDQIEILKAEIVWRKDEREQAFIAVGADDYPDGDLVIWIRVLQADLARLKEINDWLRKLNKENEGENNAGSKLPT